MSTPRDEIHAAITNEWAAAMDPGLPYWDARAVHHERLAELYQQLTREASPAERLALLDAISYRRREAGSARKHAADEVTRRAAEGVAR